MSGPIKGLFPDDGGGACIHVSSGKRFHVMDPRPEEIEIAVIAHALSKLCRWTGQCREFYSVAQHSIFVAKALRPHGPRLQLLGLLHDAPEAYLGDVSRPLKVAIREVSDVYDEAEYRLEHAIYKRFGIKGPSTQERTLIKWADDLALAVEARDIVDGDKPWVHDLPDPTGHVLFPRSAARKPPKPRPVAMVFKIKFALLMAADVGYDARRERGDANGRSA